MAKWGEQLPLSSLYHARRLKVYEKLKAVKKLLKSAKNQRDKQRKREKREKARQQKDNNNEHHQQQTKSKKNGKEADDINAANSGNMFRKAFGSVIEKIMVTPMQLVQLLQRGRTEFERVAVGLYVRCMVTKGKKQQQLWLVEQIKHISWNAKPYAMYGKQLTVLLHFDHHCCTINAVQFRKPEVIKKLVRQQKLTANFISPSGAHIMHKSDELQAALRDTVRLTAHPFQKPNNG
uniref:DUF663 domain-containing protein n=1 Tax=Globodera pallida TaxID=36090 RepID=A0A183BWF0_GLOPA